MRRALRKIAGLRFRILSRVYCSRFGHREEVTGRYRGWDNAERLEYRCSVCGGEWSDDDGITHPNCRCALIPVEPDPFGEP